MVSNIVICVTYQRSKGIKEKLTKTTFLRVVGGAMVACSTRLTAVFQLYPS